jgi:hypothetical protein
MPPFAAVKIHLLKNVVLRSALLFLAFHGHVAQVDTARPVAEHFLQCNTPGTSDSAVIQFEPRRASQPGNS